jgi:hypothetical protein
LHKIKLKQGRYTKKFTLFSFPQSKLYTAGIKHNSGLVSEGLGREVFSESSTYNTIGSMGLGDPSPQNTDVGAILVLLGGLVDIGHSLAHVKVSVFLGTDTIQLQKRPLGVLFYLAPEKY